LTIASVVVVFPECLLPTTAITGIAGNDVMVCFTFFVLSLYCVFTGQGYVCSVGFGVSRLWVATLK
jgi:hypothetical protein